MRDGRMRGWVSFWFSSLCGFKDSVGWVWLGKAAECDGSL